MQIRGKTSLNEWQNHRRRGRRYNQKMIFKPLSPGKQTRNQHEDDAPTTSNAFTALQQDHIGVEYDCPASSDEGANQSRSEIAGMLNEKEHNSDIPSHKEVNLEQMQGPVKESQMSSPETTRMQGEMVQQGDVPSHVRANLEYVQRVVQELQMNRPEVAGVLDKEMQNGDIANTTMLDVSSNVQDTGKKDHLTTTEKGYQTTSQEMDDEYRVIYSEDDIEDSHLDHKDPFNDDLLDVFDLGDAEDLAMEVNQIARQQKDFLPGDSYSSPRIESNNHHTTCLLAQPDLLPGLTLINQPNDQTPYLECKGYLYPRCAGKTPTTHSHTSNLSGNNSGTFLQYYSPYRS